MIARMQLAETDEEGFFQALVDCVTIRSRPTTTTTTSTATSTPTTTTTLPAASPVTQTPIFAG